MQADDISIRLSEALALQRRAYHAEPVPDLAARRQHLLTLRRFVKDHEAALCQAISADYGHRSQHETLLAEVVPVLSGIDHTLRHLRRWMKPQRRGVDRLSFGLASNRVIPQPLGVVGVIVPWNFPLNLSLVPLTAIFAAGNRALVKMSENSRHLAQPADQGNAGLLPAPTSCSSSTRPAASASPFQSCPSTTCCSPARAPPAAP
jgi:coniferyl-aldehyde dehydrogenase